MATESCIPGPLCRRYLARASTNLWCLYDNCRMGCDIYSYGEQKVPDRWVCVRSHVLTGLDRFPGSDPEPLAPEPFDRVSYPHFAFLAGVRNDWRVPPIAEPRGLPADASAYTRYFYFDPYRRNEPRGGHSASWLSMEELIGFDYDRTFEDHAPMYELNGRWYYEYKCIEAAHGGRTKTYREFLGPEFLQLPHALKSVGVERVVFWFDN